MGLVTKFLKKNNEENEENEDIAVIPYNLIDNLKVTKNNCKLCKSQHREEAELYYETTPNYKTLTNWLKNDKNMDISYPAVRNHILFHFKAKEREEYLGEYAKDIVKWRGMQENRIQSMKTRMAILNREMIIIAAETEDHNIIERRKSAETIKKIADTLLIYDNKLDDYEKELEPVKKIFNELKIIITEELKHIDNQQIKKILSNILEKLRDKIGDIMVNKGSNNG